MKLDLKKLSLVLGILISLTTIIWGSFKYLDNTYALAAEFKDHKANTNYQFLHIKLDKVNNRIWELEARIEKRPSDIDSKKELDTLRTEKEITIKKIEDIERTKLKD